MTIRRDSRPLTLQTKWKITTVMHPYPTLINRVFEYRFSHF